MTQLKYSPTQTVELEMDWFRVGKTQQKGYYAGLFPKEGFPTNRPSYIFWFNWRLACFFLFFFTPKSLLANLTWRSWLQFLSQIMADSLKYLKITYVIM